MNGTNGTKRSDEAASNAELSAKKQKTTTEGQAAEENTPEYWKNLYLEQQAIWKNLYLEQQAILNERSIETLLMADETRFQLRKITEFSHVNGDYYSATAKDCEFTLQCPDIEALKRNRVSYQRFASRLLSDFTDSTTSANAQNVNPCTVTCGSEADICQIVRSALRDAIEILVREPGSLLNFKGGNMMSIRMERSLFGCRPDIMVVRDKDDIGLLAIEVKFPTKNPLKEYPKVLGHSFDHAMSMNAFNMGTDLVLITSFEESHLCSLKEDDLRVVPGKAKSSTPQPQREQPFSTQSPPTIKAAPGESDILHSVSLDSSECKSTPSSDGSSPSGSPTAADTGAEFIEDTCRELCVTKTSYKAHELVKLLYTSLKIADRVYKEKAKTILRLVPNKQYSFSRVLRVVTGPTAEEGEKSYCWGKLTAILGQPILSTKHRMINSVRAAKHRTMANAHDSFYIIGSLGKGETSNVFQALTSQGDHVALKIYVKNVKDDSSLMTTKEFDKVAKDATEKERDNLLALYPSLKGKVRVVKLMKFHCVVMPVFEPIQKQMRDNKDVLKKIEKALNSFQKNKLMYKTGDLVWRHVGTYSETDEIILYDLANLEEIKDPSEEFASKYLDKLKDRIPKDPVKPSTAAGLFGRTT